VISIRHDARPPDGDCSSGCARSPTRAQIPYRCNRDAIDFAAISGNGTIVSMAARHTGEPRDARGPLDLTRVARNTSGAIVGIAKQEQSFQMSDRRAAEDDWASFVDSIEDYAILRLDVSGRVMSWNQGAQTIKGYSAHEVLGTHFSRFYSPADIAAQRPERELETAARQGRVEDDGWRIRKDGSRFWANVVITALRDGAGTVTGFANVTRDLSARAAVEERLRHSEERFRLLVEAVSDYAIYMLDPGGAVTTWNAGAHKLKGYLAEEIIGQNFSVFFHADDVEAGKPRLELETALRVGRFEEEGFRVRKDGTTFWANVVVTPVRGAGGKLLGFAKVTRDLTERVETERMARELIREQAARAAAQAAENHVRNAALAAQEAARRAEEANRVKDEFLATVSHELRTPLNAIVGWAALLRSRNSDPALIRGLDVIHRNAFAQNKIIDDILDVSRIITGKLRLDPRPVDLINIVRDAIEVMMPSLTAKHLSLTFDPPTYDCVLLADPERLQQVVWNLLSNAVKFSDAGGAVTITIERADDSFVLTVADSGRGIEPAFMPFVFDRFKQADSSVTRRVGGLGLGLAIVRHLVEMHGGEVRARSDGPGRGATFTITLPARAPISKPAAPPAEQPEQAPDTQLPRAASLHGQRVLVVDDEEDARELSRTVLNEAGADVQTASSAREAFALLQSYRPHVLVSDIGMPGEDGFSLIQRVRALPDGEGGNVAAVALTAFTRGQDKTRALAAGFDAHLSKPVHPDELTASVAALARRL
jgi:PAS domain S-box-containing protein